MFVSAVVPVYNSANTLERAINSLLIQPEINEIFIVDDGSTDGSYELELELELKHPIIKVLIHSNRKNRGASASRNVGLKYCSNEWIQFLDADDELLKGKILDQTTLTDANVPIIVGCSIWRNLKRNLKKDFDKDIWNGLLMADLGNTCSNLWNKKFIFEVGGWNEKLINTQEYDLMFRICKVNCNFRFSYLYLTVIHEVPNSISRNSNFVYQKVLNQVTLRRLIFDYISESKILCFSYRVNFNGYLGTLFRNNKGDYLFHYSKFFYLLYKVRKSILDRL